MSRTNKIQRTKKALLEALEKSLGVVTTACKSVGVDRSTFYKYVNEDEEFAKQVKDIGEVALDFVESQNFQLIKDKNPTAIIFYLKTKGKHRGFVERKEVEHSGKDGQDINPNIIINNLQPPITEEDPEDE